jgi:small-conductance mechanosensitive channel
VLAAVWIRRRLDALLDSRYRQRIDAMAAKSSEVVSVTRVWHFLDASLRFVRSATIFVLALMYLRYVFALFPQTRPAAQRVTGYIVGPLTTMWGSFVAWIPDLIFLVILVFVVRIILRLMRRFFEAVEQGRIHLANFDPDWAAPTYKLLRPMVIAFALIVGYPYIPGSGSEAFKGVSLFLGIVFSLGSSSFIANMIAGYSMTYRRAFKLGDVVKIGDVMGVVTTVRLQVTHIRTIKNEEIVVPNSQILNASVTNYTSLAQSNGLILHTTVGIGYETPWRQVEAMLLDAARRTPGLMAAPPPYVLHLQLGDFCVTYELNVYCSDPTKMRTIYTDLHRHILDVFNEYGVQIMTPAYEGDPEIPKVVPKEQWYLAPARPESASRKDEAGR